MLAGANPLDENRENRIRLPSHLWGGTHQLLVETAATEFHMDCECRGFGTTLACGVRNTHLQNHINEIFSDTGPFRP